MAMGMSQDILDLSPVRTRGRAQAPLAVEYIRDLTPADLVLLEVERGTKPPAVQSFRDSHHRVARCFASGMTPGQVGAQTGYSQSRLSILSSDPSFQDLIAVYRKAGAEAFAEYTDIAMGNMVKAERLVEDALEAVGEAPEPLELAQIRPLLDIISDRADRFGYPRGSTQVNVNLDFAGRLENARRRSGLTLSPPQPEKEGGAKPPRSSLLKASA